MVAPSHRGVVEGRGHVTAGRHAASARTRRDSWQGRPEVAFPSSRRRHRRRTALSWSSQRALRNWLALKCRPHHRQRRRTELRRSFPAALRRGGPPESAARRRRDPNARSVIVIGHPRGRRRHDNPPPAAIRVRVDSGDKWKGRYGTHQQGSRGHNEILMRSVPCFFWHTPPPINGERSSAECSTSRTSAVSEEDLLRHVLTHLVVDQVERPRPGQEP